MASRDKTNDLSSSELAIIGVVMGACLLVGWVWPWSWEWLWLLLLGGVPALVVAVLPFWLAWSVWHGLRLRGGGRWRVEATGDTLTLRRGTRSVKVALADLGSARLARQSNWGDSRFVEDALTLWDQQGRRLVKLPTSAEGFPVLLERLTSRAVPVSHVEVSAPTFLD